MTIRQRILDIMEDSPNQEILLARLVDMVECEHDRAYSMGEKSGRHGANWDATVRKLTGASA